MDVTLVLTHRCNLDCGYCYAGEHHKSDMDPQLLRDGVELLFADDARRVQLSFFGGEPLLAFDSLERAVVMAKTRCSEENRELAIQLTTNASAIRDEHVAFFNEHDINVTVSIDGIAEAHDINRPKAGGGSSYSQVVGGMRRLLASGRRPQAMMVITPETAPYVYRSVSWLWTEGINTVRANLNLAAPWGQQERDELREQLTSVGIELAGRRLRGEPTRFVPFEPGMGRRARATPPAPRAVSSKSEQVVVGVSGSLYPCAPMVGEDRDDGPEARLRLGHISAGPTALLSVLESRGAGCAESGKCACAAYLETGDRDKAGPVGLWYAALCREIGAACAQAIERHGAAAVAPGRGRRPFLIGLVAAAGLSVGVPLMIRAGVFGNDEPEGGCPRTSGQIDELQPAGGVSAPPEPGPVEPEPIEIKTRGELRAPEPEPQPPGGIGAPEPQDLAVKGDIGAPEPDLTIDGAIGAP